MNRSNNEYMFIKYINAGYLKIGEDGKVWRIARKYKERKFPVIPPKELKYVGSSGYSQLLSRKNGKQYNCYVHRLIWIYFKGEIPNNLEINHKNGIKTDNRLENLELLTKSENAKHAYRIGLEHGLKGEKNGSSKLTENNIREIRLRFSNGEKRKLITRDFGISWAHLYDIVNKKRWSHII